MSNITDINNKIARMTEIYTGVKAERDDLESRLKTAEARVRELESEVAETRKVASAPVLPEDGLQRVADACIGIGLLSPSRKTAFVNRLLENPAELVESAVKIAAFVAAPQGGHPDPEEGASKEASLDPLARWSLGL